MAFTTNLFSLDVLADLEQVEEIVRATVAPAVNDGAADWLAAVHMAKDIFNVWLPPVLGAIADATRCAHTN